MNEKTMQRKIDTLELSLLELERTAVKLIRWCAVEPEKTADTVIIDTETTGLSEIDDELLQVSIIDDKGSVLYNSYLRPLHHTSWEDAQSVNHITPEMVADAPSIYSEMPKINAILKASKTVIGYNLSFDETFLYCSGGMSLHSKNRVDVMEMFAPVYGEWNDHFKDYKWQKLTTAADFYDYDWKSRPEGAHNSLGDCFATLYVYQHIIKDHEQYSEENNSIKDTLQDFNNARPFPDNELFRGVEKFHMMAALNNVVLGVRATENDGGVSDYSYATWSGSLEKGLEMGHYDLNRADALEDFALRAGLIPADRILSVEEYAAKKQHKEVCSKLGLEEDEYVYFNVIKLMDNNETTTVITDSCTSIDTYSDSPQLGKALMDRYNAGDGFLDVGMTTYRIGADPAGDYTTRQVALSDTQAEYITENLDKAVNSSVETDSKYFDIDVKQVLGIDDSRKY